MQRRIEEENRSLKNDIDLLAKVYCEATEAKHKMAEEKRKMAEANEKMAEELSEATRENKNLKENLDSLISKETKCFEVERASAKQTVAQLLEENNMLISMLEQCRDEKTKIEEELNRMIEKCARADSEKLMYMGNLDVLMERIEEIREEKRIVHSDLKEAEDYIEKVEEEAKFLESNVDILMSRIEMVRERKQEVIHELLETNERMNKLLEQNKELELDRDDLQERSRLIMEEQGKMEDQLKVSKEKVEEMVTEMDSLRAQRDSLLEEIGKLKELESSVTQLNIKCTEWKGKYDAVVEEKTAVEKQLRDANEMIENMKVDAEQVRTDRRAFEEENERLKQLNDQLDLKLFFQTDIVGTVENRSLQNDLDTLGRNYELLKKERDKLQEQVKEQTKRHENDDKTLTQRYQPLSSDLTNRKTSMLFVQTENKRSRKSETDPLSAAVGDLSEDKEGLKKALVIAKGILKDTTAENERLQKDLDMLVGMFERIREEKEECQKATEQNKVLEINLETVMKLNDALHEERDDLLDKLLQANDVVQRSCEENKLLRNNAEVLNLNIKLAKMKTELAEANAKKCEETSAKLQDEVHTLKTSCLVLQQTEMQKGKEKDKEQDGLIDGKVDIKGLYKSSKLLRMY